MRIVKFLAVAYLLLAAGAAGAQTLRQRAAGMTDTQKFEMCKSTANAGSPDGVEWCSIALESRLLPQRRGLLLANRGIAHEKAGNLQAALDDLNEAFDIVDNDQSALFVLERRAMLFYRAENYAAAVADFSDLLRYQPTAAGHWHNRGLAHYRMGNWDLAIQDYSQAIRLSPASADAFYWRGQAYLEKKQWDEAIADYSQAIRLNPANADAFKTRGLLYGTEKADYVRGINDLLEFSRLRPNDASGPVARALLYEIAEDYDRALQEYDAAAKLAPNNFEILKSRTQVEELKAKAALSKPGTTAQPGGAAAAGAGAVLPVAENARLVVFRENGMSGYMDKTGRVVIPARFTSAHEFSEGLAFVSIRSTGGFIDRSGKYVLLETAGRQKFMLANGFSDGMAAACLIEPGQTTFGCRWHYIDRAGRSLIRTNWTFGGASSSFLVELPEFHEGLVPTDDGTGKLAYMDKTGALVIRTGFSAAFLKSSNASLSKAFNFKGELAAVCALGSQLDKNGIPGWCNKWGYINRKGTLVIPAELERPLEFSEGLAALAVNGNMGYIDTSNKQAIAAQFDEAFPFSDGVAQATLAKKPVLIDKDGKVICPLPAVNSGSIHFSEGLSPFSTRVQGNFKYGFVDKACRVVISAKFNDAREFSEGLAAVQQGAKWGFIDKTGELVIAAQFEMPEEPFRGGVARIMGGVGGFAYIDKTGKLLKPVAGPPPANAAASAQPGRAAPAGTASVEAPKAAEPSLAQQASTYLGKAQEFIRKGDPAGAVAANREAVRLQPDKSDYRLSLARTLIDAGQFAEAIPEVEMVLPQFPDAYWYRFTLVEALAGAGRKSEALAQLDVAAKAGAPLASVLAEKEKMLGREAAAKGDYAAAIPHFLKANELVANPDLADDRIQIALAFALARTGQKEAALKVMEDAAAPHRSSLVIPAAREKLKAEIAAAAPAGSQPPAPSPAWDAAVAAYANAELAAQKYKQGYDASGRGDNAAAVASFQEAVRLAPDNHLYRHLLGYALLQTGAFAAAIPHCERAVELRPDEAWYHMNLAQALAGAGQKEAALKSADKAVAVRPDWVPLREARDELMAKPAKPAPAPAASAPAPAATTPAPASAAPVNPNAAQAAQAFEKGTAAWLKSDQNTAIASFQEAVRLAPENDQYVFKLALQLHAYGRYAESIPYYQMAIKLKPNEPSYHYDLAEAYAELGKKNEAMREADIAVKLAPNNEYAIASRNRVVAKLKSKSSPN